MTALLHRSPTEDEARDHALIGWSSFSAAHVWGVDTDGKTCRVYLGEQLEPDYILEIGPFGFPILTDELRDRLIAKMEAAE